MGLFEDKIVKKYVEDIKDFEPLSYVCIFCGNPLAFTRKDALCNVCGKQTQLSIIIGIITMKAIKSSDDDVVVCEKINHFIDDFLGHSKLSDAYAKTLREWVHMERYNEVINFYKK